MLERDLLGGHALKIECSGAKRWCQVGDLHIDGKQNAEPDRVVAELDDDGNDLRLAETTARMSAEDRAASEANVRAWVARAQRSLRSRREEPTEV